jgi:hypothetical protein
MGSTSLFKDTLDREKMFRFGEKGASRRRVPIEVKKGK